MPKEIKWEYSHDNSGMISRATNMLLGENEQIITRKSRKFRPCTREDYELGLYGHADSIVSEEEALRYAIEELGLTKEEFYAE